MYLEHLGIAVADAAAVRALYEKLLGLTPYKTETVDREGVCTHFLDAGAKLELLEALGPDSPVARHLEKRGEGLHHLAFRVDDVDAAFAHAQQLGFQPLGDAPKPGADGKRIFFLHPRDTHGVLIELCGDTDAMPPARHVPFDGTTLATFTFGDPARPPLLLLHGAAGATQLETLPLARELERDFFVIALDHEGHGASGEAAQPATLFRFAQGALAVLDAFETEQAHLVGYSLGGAVALLMALQHPARVTRMAVHATNLAWDDLLVSQMQARLDPDAFARRTPETWSRFDEVHQGRARSVFAAARAFTRTLPAFAPQVARLADVQTPTLVSAGDSDDLFPLGKTLDLYRLLPAARLAILPGVRHALRPDDARVLAPLVRSFLAG